MSMTEIQPQPAYQFGDSIEVPVKIDHTVVAFSPDRVVDRQNMSTPMFRGLVLAALKGAVAEMEMGS